MNYAEPADVHSLCSIIHPGDLVEFCAIGQAHHWVVYLGSGSCVRLKEGCVTEESIFVSLLKSPPQDVGSRNEIAQRSRQLPIADT